MIPILKNHDPAKVIGYLENDGAFRFSPDCPDITRETLFDIFGNCGVRIEEAHEDAEGELIIEHGRILAFSLSPKMEDIKLVRLRRMWIGLAFVAVCEAAILALVFWGRS